ncbi:hypothetical protein WDU94_003633 [Cyamophila willieti]
MFNRNKIEISNIPSTVNNTNEVVSKVLEKVNGEKIEEKSYATEIRKFENQVNVIVHFESVVQRDKIIKKKRAERTVKLGGVMNNADETNIYINESLTPYNAKLYAEAKKIKREKNYAFIWVRDGKILLKKTEQSRPMRLMAMDDLGVHVNVQGLKGKWDSIVMTFKKFLHNLDVIVFTETQIVYEEEAQLYNFKHFNQVSYCRTSMKGGGIIVYVREEFQMEKLLYDFDEAESINLKLSNVKTKQEITLVSIYRPPNNNALKFIDDLNWWLQMCVKKKETVIMIGDINVCTLKRNNINSNYLNVLYNNNLLPTILKEVTRERLLDDTVTSSCIDHINVKIENYDTLSSAVIQEPIADHYMTGLRISAETQQRNQRKCETKSINIINEKKLQEEILKIPWHESNNYEDPVLLYDDIQSKFNCLYSKCTETIQKSKKEELCPWVDFETKQEIEKKKMCFSHWKHNKTNKIMYEVFKHQRNIVTNMIKKKKRIYFYKLFNARAGNIQKTWDTINFMLERKNREENENTLKRNFQTENGQELANELNNNFIQQVKTLKEENKGPLFNLQYHDHVPQNNLTSFYLKKATDMDIERIISNLNNTGPGIDGIRLKEIKNYKYLFIPIIKKLINLIIMTNIIPDKLKISCITALYKKGPVDHLGSYRPVGSLPIIEKILEKYLNKNISKYLDQHNIIPNFQHGFQKNKSTMTLLEDVSELIIPALDNRMFAVMIAVDLKSAFDALEHPVLIEKFKKVGILYPLIENYFKNRVQVVKVGKELSNVQNIEFGVVQGGINSPQWYNLYTHDIKYLPLNGEIKMFADDTAIINIHKNLDIAIKNAQEDLIMIQKFFYNNSIFINNNKTEAMVIGNIYNRLNSFITMKTKIKCHSRTCLENENYQTYCSCPMIDYKENFRYLGIYIDYDFKFKAHVEIITKKLRIIMFRLNKSYVNRIPMNVKRTIYYSLIESVLRYGVILYSYCPDYVLNSLNNIQRKLLRKIFSIPPTYLLTPKLLCKQILLENNFSKEEYRRTVPVHYQMRRAHFIKSVANTQYGERKLSYVVPSLLQQYCTEFVGEENPRIIKKKIKEKLIQENVEP